MFSNVIILDARIEDIKEIKYAEGYSIIYYLNYTYKKKEYDLEENVVLISLNAFKKGEYMKVVHIEKYPEDSFIYLWRNIIVSVMLTIILPFVFVCIFWVKSSDW